MRPWAASWFLVAMSAAADVPPTLDAGAPEGAETTAHRDAELDSYLLPVGPYSADNRPARALTGRVIWSAHRLDDPDATTTEVMAGYEARLAAMGFEPLFACRGRDCGGFDFRFGIELLPAPGMLFDVADFEQLSAATPDGDRLASVLVSRALGAVYVQTVVVAPSDTRAHPLGPSPSQETTPDTVAVEGVTDDLAEQLAEQGHVVIDGLAFEPGGARLSAGSAPALDRLAAFLGRDPEIKVAIVGHSDTAGSYEANLALSRRRAEAVRAALVERGVPAGRMEARGVAYLAPIASNATEPGRQRNRRVELVVK